MKTSVVILLLLSCLVHGSVILVPADQPTIQAGIDAAVSGIDEVVIAPGIYAEAIDFKGKAITVRSASGDPNDTIIDGTGNFHVVKCISGEDPNSVLEGFTITGGLGNGTYPDSQGGGMLILNASPTVDNCLFVENRAGGGGAMFIENSRSTIVNCGFHGNRALSLPVGSGGAISTYDASLTITKCDFVNNYATAKGGAIMFQGAPSHLRPLSINLVSECRFIGNLAGDDGDEEDDGGAIRNQLNSWLTLNNCLFSGNRALHEGGALNSNHNFVAINNCTFSNNTAAVGGGFYYSGGGTNLITIDNSIFWENSPDQLSGVDPNNITVRSSDIEGGLPLEVVDGGGNVNADPQFVDADGPDDIPGTIDDNLRLTPGSPAVDSGNNTLIPHNVYTDLAGNPRAVDDPLTLNTGVSGPPTISGELIVDMGALELNCCNHFIRGDLNCDGIVDIFDFVRLSFNWLQKP